MESIPHPWRLHQSRSSGKYYYFNLDTKESLWQDNELPKGWAWGRKSEQDPKFYVHLSTNTRQTTFPVSDIASSGANIAQTNLPVESQLSYQASQAAAREDEETILYIPDEATHGSNIPSDIASKRDYLFNQLVPD